jgi:ACS family tartrate transporter-like MFS transporter
LRRKRTAGAVIASKSDGERLTIDESELFARVSRRCIPLLLLGYIFSYIDRVNIGFAAITASKDLGMSPSVFGFGAGIFFIGYLLFEVPSNYILERVGARRWLARIMITCGIVAAAMVFVTGKYSFYAVRILLGAVEAGLFPGVMLYLTYWFPQRYRARYVGIFAIGIPLASVVGAPISGFLLNLNGKFGLKGWQWLYVLEAIPCIVLGVLIWFILTDTPRDAAWLTREEREWLQNTIDKERASHPEKSSHMKLLESLRMLADRRVIVLSLVFFATAMPSYGLSIWLPQIVHDFGLGNIATGFVSAIPFACGSLAMIYWARHSDRKKERDWHTGIAAFIAAAGMMSCYWISSPWVTMIALSLSGVGIFGMKGPFLSGISETFGQKTAAVGIAMVVSIGNLSGLAAPWLIGKIKDMTGVYQPALLAVGFCSLIGAILVVIKPSYGRSSAGR